MDIINKSQLDIKVKRINEPLNFFLCSETIFGYSNLEVQVNL